MKSPFLIISVLCILLFCLAVSREAGAQRRTMQPSSELLARLQQLELRVAQLERAAGREVEQAVFNTPAISVEAADERVRVAREQLRYSEQVFDRGYISEWEVESARFTFARAAKMLEIAKAAQVDGADVNQLRQELAVLAAEEDLALAARKLRSIRTLADRGFLSQAELEVHERAVAQAEERLATVRAGETAPPEDQSTEELVPEPPVLPSGTVPETSGKTRSP